MRDKLYSAAVAFAVVLSAFLIGIGLATLLIVTFTWIMQ